MVLTLMGLLYYHAGRSIHRCCFLCDFWATLWDDSCPGAVR